MGQIGTTQAGGGLSSSRAGRFVASLHPVIADGLVAVVLTVPLLIDLSRFEAPGAPLPFRDADALGYVLVAMLVLPIAFRRRYPAAVFLVILAAAVITVLLAYRPVSYGFGLIVATYSSARWCDRRRSLTALGLALAFSVFAKVRAMVGGVDIDLFAWPLDIAYFAGAWFLGDSIRTRAQQATELVASREALARRAVEREQLRIARELHDSIGHSLTTMVLYTGVADRQLTADPDRARELLDTVAATGRDALSDMDGLVRVLRHEQPRLVNLDDLEVLVEEFRDLGLSVDVTVTGVPEPLPELVELAAYRITQEALTNTLRHADTDSASVSLDYSPRALSVVVADDGRGCPDDDPASGERHGLMGMRERVAALGGDLQIGADPSGRGFVVRAHLPLGSVA